MKQEREGDDGGICTKVFLPAGVRKNGLMVSVSFRRRLSTFIVGPDLARGEELCDVSVVCCESALALSSWRHENGYQKTPLGVAQLDF